MKATNTGHRACELVNLGNRLKTAGHYDAANIVTAHLLIFYPFLRIEYETAVVGCPHDEDWSDRLDDDCYHDLVVVVSPNGERLCIPVPLLEPCYLLDEWRHGTFRAVPRRKHGCRELDTTAVSESEICTAMELAEEGTYPLHQIEHQRCSSTP